MGRSAQATTIISHLSSAVNPCPLAPGGSPILRKRLGTSAEKIQRGTHGKPLPLAGAGNNGAVDPVPADVCRSVRQASARRIFRKDHFTSHG